MRTKRYASAFKTNHTTTYIPKRALRLKRKRWHPISVVYRADTIASQTRYSFKKIFALSKSLLDLLTTAVVIKSITVHGLSAAGVEGTFAARVYGDLIADFITGNIAVKSFPGVVNCSIHSGLKRAELEGKTPISKLFQAMASGVEVVTSASHETSVEITVNMVYLMRKVEMTNVISQASWLAPIATIANTPIGIDAKVARLLYDRYVVRN